MLQTCVHLLSVSPAAIFPIPAQRPQQIPGKTALEISQPPPDRLDVRFTHSGSLEKSIRVDLVITQVSVHLHRVLPEPLKRRLKRQIDNDSRPDTNDQVGSYGCY